MCAFETKYLCVNSHLAVVGVDLCFTQESESNKDRRGDDNSKWQIVGTQ